MFLKFINLVFVFLFTSLQVVSQTFSPTVNILLSNLNCDSISDLTITVSQDSSEVDMDSATFISDGGSFTISTMNLGDNIGLSTMILSSNTFTADLIINNIVSSSEITIEAIDQLNGLVLGTFSIKNLFGGGVEIVAASPDDGNNFTNYGNSSTILFSNVFTNPSSGILNFSTNISSELGDIDLQNFSKYISCLCLTVYSVDTINACENYLWNGIVYDSSGFYSDTLISIIGCDSILILDLRCIELVY